MTSDAALSAIDEDLRHIEALASDLGVGIHVERDDDGTIFLSDIGRDRSNKATKGNGARIMKAICVAADLNGVALESSFMTSEAGLKTYYERFGLKQDGEPGEITNIRREPQGGPLPINGVTLTAETIRCTREHFAESSRLAISEIADGTTKVDDRDGTIAWFEEGIRSGLAGESDHTVAFRQRALWMQTGDMPPVLSPSSGRVAA